MRVRVLGTLEASAWASTAERVGARDVYFLPQFHRAYERQGHGEAFAFVAEEDGELLFYPSFLRRIDSVAGEAVVGDLYDLETVSGYTGPVATSADRAFLDAAWGTFSDWCRERGVVAEFVRFHPFLENAVFAPSGMRIVDDRDLVVVDLEGGPAAIWRRYPPVQRNMVRKAERAGLVGLELPLEEGLGEFRRLYDATMERVGASPAVRFEQGYYDELRAGLAQHVRLFAVSDGPDVVAAALFLVAGELSHYYLAGSDAARRRTAPNNLLVHTAALAAAEAGCRWLHLGGGRLAAADDELLRFKASISRLRLPYLLGRRVHDDHAFERLCAQWLAATGVAELPPHSFPYRASPRV